MKEMRLQVPNVYILFLSGPSLYTLPSRDFQAYQRAEGEASEEGISEVPSWRQTFMSLSGKAVRSATENGTFDDLR